jgi:hypothetical protein
LGAAGAAGAAGFSTGAPGATGLLSAPDAGGFEAESFSEGSLAIESVSTLAAGIPKATSSPPF